MAKTKLFSDKYFYKNLIRLGLPIALQQLLYSVFNVVDTAMIAQLGADATAGVGAGTRWMFMIIVVSIGLTSATTSLVSQYWGIKDFENIRKTTGISLFFAFLIGLIFTFTFFLIPDILIKAFTDNPAMINYGAKYLKMLSFGVLIWCFNFVFSTSLKSIEHVKITLAASIVSITVNVFLNWIFIFGNLGAPKMGVQGAALGTVISYYINFVLLIGICMIKNNEILHNLKQYVHWNKEFFKKFTKIMTPAFFNEVLWVAGNMTYSVALGRYGNANYGSYAIYSTIESMFFTFFIGLSSAGCIIIGKELGKGNIEKGWNYSLKTFWIAPILACFISGFLIVLRYPILNLMLIPDPYMVDMIAKLLLMYALVSPLRIIPFMTIVGIFRAGGDTITGLWIDTSNVWLIGVPLTLIAAFVLKAPFEWVFLAMFTEDIVKIVLCVVYFYRKKWLNQLTQDSTYFKEQES